MGRQRAARNPNDRIRERQAAATGILRKAECRIAADMGIRGGVEIIGTPVDVELPRRCCLIVVAVGVRHNNVAGLAVVITLWKPVFVDNNGLNQGHVIDEGAEFVRVSRALEAERVAGARASDKHSDLLPDAFRLARRVDCVDDVAVPQHIEAIVVPAAVARTWRVPEGQLVIDTGLGAADDLLDGGIGVERVWRS